MEDVLPAGTRLGRYEIVARLALGGMAEIYLARMTGLAGFAKHVVLKRILPSFAKDAEFVRMFFNEARYAATLDHPNIAHVYDLGEEAGLHYFTMEYLHGEDCRALLRELAGKGKKLPLEHALAIVCGAAAGCHFAHETVDDAGRPLGLVHRDVSPSNVVVTYAGAVKLVDFGIAKATRMEDATAVGVTKGKLAYMAPEQCKGLVLDRRVDVYALGVLLYELTTLRRAFVGQNDAQVMWQVVSGEVASPLALDPSYPPALDAIVRRAMHVDRDQRYETAREFQQALEAFAREAGLAMNATGLAEFFEATMGPKLEPWRDPARAERQGRATTPEPALIPAARAPTAPPEPFTPPPRGPNPFAGRTPTPTPLAQVAAAPSPAPISGPVPLAATTTDAPTLVPVRPISAAGTDPRKGIAHAATDPSGLVPVAPPGLAAGTDAKVATRAPSRWPWIIAGAVVASAAATVVVVVTADRGKRDDAPVTMIAERGTATVEGADAGPAPVADAGPAAALAIDAAAPATPGGATRGSGGDRGSGKPRGDGPTGEVGKDPLAQAFGKRLGAIGDCFAKHVAAGAEAPKLQLRFELDTSGTPTKVTVAPAAVAGTPLGTCVAEVARATRFPAQAAPIGFSIPVSVKTTGGP